ncbi:hypothetical protein JX265_010188 [Neoarthrinium moseri]|uniref:Heterokaryon incompatibility domain-containing protein n=1 Tax=Neoarthrinium moseri TaxID=1658444 RepID=A0A9Q0AIJ8_9PEZI|nr:hypothetical protein JX265_010188 [Neoarthrinium moseri]
MRLLNVFTRELEDYVSDAAPSYAILSHTWHDDEVTFQDMRDPEAREGEGTRGKKGYAKIEECCRQAVKDGYGWVWIDTCCIDKSSSAELSEAINSMYSYYHNAAECYIFLADVPAGSGSGGGGGGEGEDPGAPGSAFRRSRWFTRGWTLQEFLAPRKLVFFDGGWGVCLEIIRLDMFVGTAKTWEHYFGPAQYALLEEITGIDAAVVATGDFRRVPLAQRFSWAAGRTTTRVEDMAYSLLGILGVNMPLLYGEGEAAFRRLQEEAIRTRTDQSYLAWGLGMSWTEIRNTLSFGRVLAKSPHVFKNCGRLASLESGDVLTLPIQSLSNRGLQVELSLLPVDNDIGVTLALLPYGGQSDQVAIPLVRCLGTSYYRRLDGSPPFVCPRANVLRKAKKQTIYLLDDDGTEHMFYDWKHRKPSWLSRWLPLHRFEGELHFDFKTLLRAGYRLESCFPPVRDTARPSQVSGVRPVDINDPEVEDAFMVDFLAIVLRKGADRIGLYLKFHAGFSRAHKRRVSDMAGLCTFRVHGNSAALVLASTQSQRNAWTRGLIKMSPTCMGPDCPSTEHLHLAHELDESEAGRMLRVVVKFRKTDTLSSGTISLKAPQSHTPLRGYLVYQSRGNTSLSQYA